MSGSSEATGAGRDLDEGEVRPLLARVLGVGEDDLGEVSARQVLRRRSGRRLVTWRTGRGDVVVVVGTGGPRRGCVLEVTDDGHPLAAFRVEDDPRLPGMGVLEARVALPGVEPGRIREWRRHRYRPLSRAVVRVDLTDGGRVWAKVVRPSEVDELEQVHRAVAAVAPSPPLLGVDRQQGLVVLGDLGGPDLRGIVRRSPGALPMPSVVPTLADALATARVTREVGRRQPMDALDQTRARVANVMPWAAQRADAIADRARALDADAAVESPLVVIHGDLHAAQLVPQPGGAVALLDLDDVGRGAAVDDAARMLGHLACTVMPLDDPAAHAWHDALVNEMLARHDEAALRARVGAVVLGLSMGPHRVQREDWRERADDRLALAEHWLG